MSHKSYVDECLSTFKLVDIPTLKGLIANAESELRTKENAEKAKSLAELLALFEKTGMTDKEVIAVLKKRKGVKVPGTVKFRHPSNPRMTWTGMGKRPDWINAWEDQHGNLDAVRVSELKQAA